MLTCTKVSARPLCFTCNTSRHSGGPSRRKVLVRASTASAEQQQQLQQPNDSTRRQLLVCTGVSMLGLLSGLAKPAAAASIEIISDEPGIGKHPAEKKDLLLVHYVGKIKETGQIFDSTLGGLTYRDGGPGVLRPLAIQLGGAPVPGLCAGLRQGLEGMRVGGRRSFIVPPELGFSRDVLAPYAVVPAGSTLVYEVQLLRLSSRGPDELTQGIDRCGQGGASQQTQKCDQIEIAEFV